MKTTYRIHEADQTSSRGFAKAVVRDAVQYRHGVRDRGTTSERAEAWAHLLAGTVFLGFVAIVSTGADVFAFGVNPLFATLFLPLPLFTGTVSLLGLVSIAGASLNLSKRR